VAAPSPATDPSIQDLIASRPWLRYNAMDGLLLDDVPLNAIADGVGTPTWVYSASNIFFSGVGKSARELDLALSEDIGQISGLGMRFTSCLLALRS
jgi:hypothetical protein